MYHIRMNQSHYESGYRWGQLLKNNHRKLDQCPTFALTQERRDFANACLTAYETHFPEVLREIQGIADGNEVSVEALHTLLFSMYCFSFENKCTCFAFRSNGKVVFGRNSDFLVSLEKLYQNCLYRLPGGYAFHGNTTAFVQMEDGVNQHGLAVGLTFVYPWSRKPGLNAGMLTRYLLEKCKTVAEALAALHTLPIASAQTLTIADPSGALVVVECNPEAIEVLRPQQEECFVAATNNFHSTAMRQYRNPEIDDWRSEERYQTVISALTQYRETTPPIPFAQSLLSGEFGFLCQYDRSKNADTVWSVVYDLTDRQIWRVEGNPSRKPFSQDTRMKFD